MSKAQDLINMINGDHKNDPQAELLFAGLYTRYWFNDGLDEEISVEDWNTLVRLVDESFNWERLSEAITDEFSDQYTAMKEGK